MKAHKLSGLVIIGWLCCAPSFAHATEAQSEAKCLSASETTPGAEMIEACTALIASYKDDLNQGRLPKPPPKVDSNNVCYRDNTPECWGRIRIARALHTRAYYYYDANDASRSMADIEEAIRLAPRWTYLLIRRADVYLLKGDYPGALRDIEYLVKTEPKSADHRLSLCHVRVVEGQDFAAARKACKEALKRRPDSPEVLERIAILEIKEGKYQAAYDTFQSALRWNPNAARPLYGRGLAAAKLGLTEQSKADIAAAHAKDSKTTKHFERYGDLR